MVILDCAEQLLEAADALAAAACASGSVRTVRADLDDLEQVRIDGAGLAGGFGVVLCHNVVQYRADPAATVARLVELLRPAGMVSVMAPNPAMDVLLAAVRRTDPQEALAVLDAETVHGRTFDPPMRRVEASTVEAALLWAGCAVEHRFGIRCVMDLLSDDDLKRDPAFYARLAELERAVCEREPYWRTARFWQLTARRAS